jgi:sugar diacid utilization regulator
LDRALSPAGATEARAGAVAHPAADGSLVARMVDVTSQVYLELLARDAPAVEYERPLIEARARGEAGEVLAELERSKLLALQVRATVEERRRREAELSALFETAGDLAALRGVDAVLQAIVHRARQLLGTDVAYLTLTDPLPGDTYMRVTDGSTSAHFQRLRLPIGAGLGGLVAQTAAPYATANYLADARFAHTPDIDGAVTEEGLVAILGVPLRLGSAVIGVLFAANRTERPFARAEVSLLASLAAHAAIALDNTRLLQEARAALEELSTANRLVRAHSQSVERAADAHDRFADLVLRGGGVEDVAAAVTGVLGGRLLVLDTTDRPLASVGEPPAPAPGLLADAVSAARTLGRAVLRGDYAVAAAAAGSEHLGALLLHRAGQLDDADQRILERAALVTALLLLFRRSVTEAEQRVRGELLGDLLTAPDRDPAGLRDRARRLNTDLDQPHVVVVAATAAAAVGSAAGADGSTAGGGGIAGGGAGGGGADAGVGAAAGRRLASAAAQLAAGRHGLAGSHGGRVVVLLPHEDPSAAAKSVAHELLALVGQPVTTGAGGPAAGPVEIAAGYADASRCLDALLALGRVGHGASMADLGFIGLVLGDGRDVAGFVQRTIGPLLAYDARRGTELVHTLEQFFATGASPIRTKDSLHVHVNTVTQRLDRIGRLIGPDWSEPERSLEVQLALRLHRARQPPQQQAGGG